MRGPESRTCCAIKTIMCGRMGELAVVCGLDGRGSRMRSAFHRNSLQKTSHQDDLFHVHHRFALTLREHEIPPYEDLGWQRRRAKSHSGCG